MVRLNRMAPLLSTNCSDGYCVVGYVDVAIIRLNTRWGNSMGIEIDMEVS